MDSLSSIARAYQGKSVFRRFWEKVAISGGPQSCWAWKGATQRFGYGIFLYQHQSSLAHRIAWILSGRELPDGLWVLHHCDNPPCCNPLHLFPGNAADNCADRDAKGRTGHGTTGPKHPVRGEGHHHAKLTEADVRSIRERYSPYRTTLKMLALEYSVADPTIARIVRGENWNHIPVIPKGAKLTDSQVLEIRRRSANGETQMILARDYDVGQSTISRILRGKNYKSVAEE